MSELVESSVAAGLLGVAQAESGLSLAEWADRAGVSKSMIWAYKDGRREPTVPTLIKLLRGAGMDLRLQLLPHDPHDEVLAARMTTEQREAWDEEQAAFVDEARRALGWAV